MTYKVSWGIIGCGDVAEVKSGPAFNQIDNSQLLAVMRRSPEKVKDFARRHNVPKYYTQVEHILADNLINAVYIATPPSSHLQITLEAIKAKKNIYLEKPMVLNNEEAKQLKEAAKNSEVKITVAHYRRALPAFIKVKELIDSNSIGEIRFVEIKILQSAKANLVAETDNNWRVIPEESGGGYFFDLAPHQIDLMLNYFGKAEKVSGQSSNLSKSYAANDLVSGMIKFESGVHFKGIWAFNVNKKQVEDSCKIYGSEGMIEFSFYGNQVFLHQEKTTTFDFENPKAIQLPMIQSTVDFFTEKTEYNPCSINEAAEVIDIMTRFSRTI